MSPIPLPATPRPSQSTSRSYQGMSTPSITSPAPFDWLHFEGRSVKTTLNNMVGLDGLARERKWRSHCVFSVDIGRRARQGVEAVSLMFISSLNRILIAAFLRQLIPHADVIFVTKYYALAHSPNYASTPRAFLLSLTNRVPPHALLVAYWGREGAALLSLPTREYFQSSNWVEERHISPGNTNGANVAVGIGRGPGLPDGIESVRSGSDFWVDGRTPESSGYSFNAGTGHTPENSLSASSAMGLGPSPSSQTNRKHLRVAAKLRR